MIFGNEEFHALNHVVHIALFGKRDDIGNVVEHIVEIVGTHLGNHNLIVAGHIFNSVLLVGEEFLVEFFAGTESDFLDLDIHIGAQPCKRNHARSQIVDFHRFAHIEDIDFATVAHTSGFKHQTACLGNGHKVANNIAVSDGHGAAGSNLLAKQRNHRTVAAKDIAKSGGDKLGDFAFLLGIEIERLGVDFRQALGAPHHIGGIHRLIGGHHHKLIHAIFQRQIGNILGTHHIGKHRLGGIDFHHRHMLVGGSVEHEFGSISGESQFHALTILHIAHKEHHIGIGELVFHLQREVVHRRFGLVHQHDLLGFIGSDLLHDFGADRATSTGNEHHRIANVGAHERIVEHNGLATQQVFNLHFLHISRNIAFFFFFAVVGIKFFHAIERKNPQIVFDKEVGIVQPHFFGFIVVENEGVNAVFHKGVHQRLFVVRIHFEAIDFVGCVGIFFSKQPNGIELTIQLIFQRSGKDERTDGSAQHQHALTPRKSMGEPAINMLDCQALNHQK